VATASGKDQNVSNLTANKTLEELRVIFRKSGTTAKRVLPQHLPRTIKKKKKKKKKRRIWRANPKEFDKNRQRD